MPFVLLLLLTLACWPDNWPRPFWTDWLSVDLTIGWYACLTWSGVALLVGGAARQARRTRRQLAHNPGRRETILQRYGSGRFYHLMALFLYYGLALYVLGWGWTVRNLGPLDADGRPQMFPGAELFILAPFLAGLILSWACFYDAERALHDSGAAVLRSTPFWSRKSYILFNLRHNLALVLAPLVLLIIQKELRRLTEYQNSPFFEGLLIGLVLAVFICLPWLLRLVLGLKPLPAGPLRARLLAAARRLNFRCSNILLWNTNGGVANAMVAGIIPQVRYVLLTDKLLKDLTPQEVEAVFGHEVGHVKHHHMIFYLGFLFISVSAISALAAALWPQLDDFLHKNEDWASLPIVALLGTYIFVVFGFLSRRCERQADIFGCRAVSCGAASCAGHAENVALSPGGRHLCSTGIRIFIEALEKVARVNGISRNRPGWLQSWQHSTIARRVEFLQRVLVDPSVEPRFQRTVRLVKWGVVLALATVLVALGSYEDWTDFWLMF